MYGENSTTFHLLPPLPTPTHTPPPPLTPSPYPYPFSFYACYASYTGTPKTAGLIRSLANTFTAKSSTGNLGPCVSLGESENGFVIPDHMGSSTPTGNAKSEKGLFCHDKTGWRHAVYVYQTADISLVLP